MIQGEALKHALARTAAAFRLVDIYVFGSRAKEIAHRLSAEAASKPPFVPESDVDIAVRPRFGVALNPRERVDVTIALEDLLEVSRVDLVVLPEADPFLALDVIRGELLYTADPDDQARYELFVLRRAGDLMPWKKERMRMILEEGAR
ncbi:nucleotidyltransferase domain-containing protein [Desulfosoma sp.]|uniref:Nucleotidyltransferase domain-containing protein n=1 Tax=Desulfacinum infernum TaxID=35837 RepID=A0A831ZU44_9BACT